MPLVEIVAVLIIVFVLLVIVASVRQIQQGWMGVVKRLGRFHSVRSPGVTFLVPFVDAMQRVDLYGAGEMTPPAELRRTAAA